MPRTAEDYRQLLASMLPQGLIWPQEADSNLGRLLHAMAEELARVDGRAGDVIDEADPGTAFELLTDWERNLGLPEQCSYSGNTLAERRAACVAKLTDKGGQRPADMQALADRLGYQVTIEEMRPFEAGRSAAGETCGGEEFAHVFRVWAPETTTFLFRAGGNQAGDRLRGWGNEKLECAITAHKPAHTETLFAYTSEE